MSERSVDGPRRVAMTTLGCKVNRADSDETARGLMARGSTFVDDLSDADAVVVNSCCVTADAEKKVRKAVRRALRVSSGPVVVTGCMAVLDPTGLAELGERVSVKPRPQDVVEALGLSHAATPAADSSGSPFRTRVAIKVEDGCDTHCAYCIVPTVRGNPVSVPMDDVVARAGELVTAGTAEIVLTGVNLGMWQTDDADLADLVEAVAATGVQRLRLSSIEPQHIDPRLVATLSSLSAVCAHLHIPLQSGSDRVLAAMARRYSRAEYIEVVERAADALPGLAVTTDVMSGFPGETDRDHADTLDLIDRLGHVMRKLHVFRYSARPGTRAYEMPEYVDPQVAEARAAELRMIGDGLREAHVLSALGRTVSVLVERAEASLGEGTSSDYLKVRIERPGLVVGSVVDATVAAADGFTAVCA